MCSNYAQSARQQLMGFDLPPPDFSYGEAYPFMSSQLVEGRPYKANVSNATRRPLAKRIYNSLR